MKMLREYLTQKMSANFRSRIFCLSFVIQNHEERTIVLLIFCVGVQHGLLCYGENIDCECLRAEWCGRYLSKGERK